jgi:hypothetical protein
VPAGSDKAHPASGNSPRDAPAQPSRSVQGNAPRNHALRPGIDCRDVKHLYAHPHVDPKLDPCPETPGN